ITDGVAVLTLDVAAQSVNVLSRDVREEFAALIERLAGDESVKAAVLTSGKPDVFIAGADVDELRGVARAEDAERLSRDGQRLLDQLEQLRFPVVAAIQGACLGGGLEVALACRYRIASDHPKTMLGLPEVQLGLIPGAGGTQRLPRLIGLRAALDLILTGKSVNARRALSLGIVDEVVHPAILGSLARTRALELAQGTHQDSRTRRRGAAEVLLDGNPLGRSVVLRKAREAALEKSGGHYPAPIAAIEVIARGYADGQVRGAQEESKRFGELAISPVAQELMYLFSATTSLKKDCGVEGEAPAPREVRKIGVLGAGFMGAGIATIAAQRGTLVRLKDTGHARIGRGLAAIRKVFQERVKRRRMTEREVEDAMSLVSGTTDLTGFGRTDLVIEAVFEDLDVKRTVLHETEDAIREDTVYASNTSTLPISSIAQAARRPE